MHYSYYCIIYIDHKKSIGQNFGLMNRFAGWIIALLIWIGQSFYAHDWVQCWNVYVILIWITCIFGCGLMLLTNGLIGISGYTGCWVGLVSIWEYITYRLHG